MELGHRRWLLRTPWILALGCVALALYGAVRHRDQAPIRAHLAAIDALTAEASSAFERALEPRAFEFPADHGAHPSFQTEWWYFTGNLRDASDRRFGFELTFFRRALEVDAQSNPSPWSSNEIYFAHFAVTDVAANEFHSFERASRAAAGLAGAAREPWSVWVGPWSARARGSDFSSLELRAADRGLELALDLRPTLAPVANGDRGLSRKGSAPGNASYYYSMPAIDARGSLALGAQRFEVSGTAWLDREWSTSGLEHGVVGWDWFAIELRDGRALMLYRLRRDAGGDSPFSSGTLIGKDGRARHLAREDFAIDELERWTSPRSGANYPSRWRIAVPSAGLELELTPLVRDQELEVSFVYWEGATKVTDLRGAEIGSAYVELVGYAEAPVDSASASRAAR